MRTLLLDQPEPGHGRSVSLTKKAAARFKISRSRRNQLCSVRSEQPSPAANRFGVRAPPRNNLITSRRNTPADTAASSSASHTPLPRANARKHHGLNKTGATPTRSRRPP